MTKPKQITEDDVDACERCGRAQMPYAVTLSEDREIEVDVEERKRRALRQPKRVTWYCCRRCGAKWQHRKDFGEPVPWVRRIVNTFTGRTIGG